MKRLTPVLALCCALSLTSQAQEKPLINSGILIAEAIKLHDEGKYKDALNTYRQISRNDTNYVYALYEAALSLHADSQFVEAIRFCEEALREKSDREREPELFTQLAISLDNNGDKTRALRVFDSALAKYPDYVPAIYNKAVTHIRMEQEDLAIPLLQKALLINPYHATSHFRLALMAVRKGRPVDGFLGLATYLLMEPQGAYSNQAIKLMSAIAGADEEVIEPMQARTSTPPGNIAEVETIVVSKIALNKQYKPLLKLDDAISRQLQVICEKLVYDKDEKDFWMQYYVPLYTSMLAEKRFEPLVNYIFSGVNIEVIQKYNKSHKKEIAKFVADVVTYTNKIKTTRELNFGLRQNPTTHYVYETKSSIGHGSKTGEHQTGPWIYNYASGNLMAKGNFNSTAKKTGTWSYYYFDGTLKGTEILKDGISEGPNVNYFANGNKSELTVYQNDLKEGEARTYFYSGALSKIIQYKAGKFDGVTKHYYSSGELKNELNYKDGVLSGPYKSYYRNGQVEVEAVYVNEKLDGPCVGFYENGKKSFEGQYQGDKMSGAWKRYHDNGQISTTENYADGLYDGEYAAYHANGKLRFKTNYRKNQASGEVVYFEEDGKPWAVYQFDKNDVKSARFFDKTGKEIGSSIAKNKQLHLLVFNYDGSKQVEKYYDDKGLQTGTETTYFPNGAIHTVANYKDGELHGKFTSYFMNGRKDYEYGYVNGTREGYYKGYHLNGKTASEGWYKDGNMTGEFLYYDNQGNQTSRENYTEGHLEGFKELYHPNGKKRVEQFYHLGWMITNTQFDTLGRVLSTSDIPTLTGPFTLVHLNGKKYIDARYENGNMTGPKTYYYYNGREELKENYVADEQDGPEKSFYPDGTLRSEGNYKKGDKTGTWKYYLAKGELSTTEQYGPKGLEGKKTYYFKDGKVDTEYEYVAGEVHGLKKKFDATGNLLYQVRFENDMPVAYTWLDANGQLLPEKPIMFGTAKINTFYSNGKPSASFEYVNGKLHGKDLQFYANGNTWMESSEHYGETEGPFMAYFPNGKLRYTATYSGDDAHGTYREFNEKGILVEEGNFYQGSYHGPIKRYDDAGKLLRTSQYYYGTLLSEK